ncbi:MAG: hypothetical protein AB8V19_04240 [Candidatus Midichloria sp.]
MLTEFLWMLVKVTYIKLIQITTIRFKNFDSNQDKIVLFCRNRGINSTDIKSCYFNDNQVNFLIVNDVDDREVCGLVKAWPVLAKIPHSK